jgi:hypothetical protein
MEARGGLFESLGWILVLGAAHRGARDEKWGAHRALEWGISLLGVYLMSGVGN